MGHCRIDSTLLLNGSVSREEGGRKEEEEKEELR